MKKAKQKPSKHYCSECGAVLSDYEYQNFGDLCENCYENLMSNVNN